MLVRVLIYLILGTLLYRAAKSWFGGAAGGNGARRVNRPSEVDDVMIQDPVCGAYFPKRKAVALNVQGTSLYFCSPECRDRYLADQA